MVARQLPARENVALYSVNRPEWVIAEQACFMYNYCTVPLYDTLGTDAIEFILTQCECKVLFCSQDKVTTLLQLADKLPLLKTVVSFDA